MSLFSVLRFIYYYAESQYAECHYAECHYTECHYAECRYAECRYAECRGATVAETYWRGALCGTDYQPGLKLG